MLLLFADVLHPCEAIGFLHGTGTFSLYKDVPGAEVSTTFASRMRANTGAFRDHMLTQEGLQVGNISLQQCGCHLARIIEV